MNNTFDEKMAQWNEKYGDLLQSKSDVDEKVQKVLKSIKKLNKEIDMEREFLKAEGKYETAIINLMELKSKASS